MKEVLKSVWRVCVREVRRMTSRPLYLFGMVLAPLFAAFFFLSLMNDGLPKNMPVAVVDNDNGTVARRLVRQLDNFRQTEITSHFMSFGDARKAMQKGEVYGIFYIPEDFSRDVLSGKQPKISFYTNNSFFVAASLLFRDMKLISVLGSASVGKEIRLAKGQTEKQALAGVQPIAVDANLKGNPWLNYSFYLNNVLLHGIFNIMVMIMTVFALGSEIKDSKAKVLLRVSRNDSFLAVMSKLLPHTVVWFIMITFIDVVLYSFMNFPCNGGLFPMLVSSYLLILAAQAMAVFFFGLLPIMRLSLSAVSLIGVLSISISGFTFPVTEMHHTLQLWSVFFPLRHYFLLYADQALNGLGFEYTWAEYVYLLLFLFLPFFVYTRLDYVLRNQKYIA